MTTATLTRPRSYVLSDTRTLLHRNLIHALRYPAMSLSTLVMPLIFLLLFKYVFGNTLGAGIGGNYIDYLTPGMLIMTGTASMVGTAVSVCTDMTGGIVDRLRTMSISRGALLVGTALSNIIQTLLAMAVLLGVATALGFRPHTDLLGWLGALGLAALTAFAMTWVAMAMGLAAKAPEGASNLPMPVILLPFLGSGFVPATSLSPGLRQFAEYQPFTPITETLRGLILGTPIGGEWILALGWCVVLTVVGYVFSRRLFDRRAER
ncbi:MAG TPA: ABC transporter permease [Pseudonocardiaceae bacterium]|nr:ABC transporter permease [Pseudonocardiaceae bacterium]